MKPIGIFANGSKPSAPDVLGRFAETARQLGLRLAAESEAARFLPGVRRLTPLEAERLQGFPDGWSCTCGCAPYSTATCRCPDGPRYRALGNAIPTTLAMWVGRRLARTIKTFVGVRCRVETLRRSLLTRGSGACSAEVP